MGVNAAFKTLEGNIENTMAAVSHFATEVLEA